MAAEAIECVFVSRALPGGFCGNRGNTDAASNLEIGRAHV